MKTSSMPGRAMLALAVAVAVGAHASSAQAANCAVSKISGAEQITLTDFTSSTSGWAPTRHEMNGTASSPKENKGGTYRWTQVSGPAVTLLNSATPQATLVAPNVGVAGAEVVIRLSVGGGDAGCDTATSQIKFKITDAHNPVSNMPPQARAIATPDSAYEGASVVLDGRSSFDPDAGTTLRYRWTQIDGPAVAPMNATTALASFVAPAVTATQTLKFRLDVSDGTLSDSATVMVNIVWVNKPPVANIECPLTVNEGQSVTLKGNGSHDPDDGIVSYRWTPTGGLPQVPEVVSGAAWDTASVTFDAPLLGYQQVGNVPFRLTVTDASGASDSKDCTVMVKDVTRPLIDVPLDITAEATSASGADVPYTVKAFDAVDGAFGAANVDEYFACAPASGSVFALDRTRRVECTAKDSAGNTASNGFNVSVVDTTAPEIEVPQSFALEATGPDGAEAGFEATSLDLVDGKRSATCSPAAGSVFALGTTQVSCGATDERGNVAQARVFEVAVHDTKPPVISAVSDDLTVEATSPLGAVATYTTPSASDLVDGDVAVTCTPVSGGTFALGTTAVDCSARDTRSNASTASFKIKVQDTTAPVIGTHGDETTEATGPDGASVAYTLPTVSDAVSFNLQATCLPASGSMLAAGEHTVTCNAVDAAGNAADATRFKVAVRDTTAPVFTGAATNLVAEATSSRGAAVTFALPAATDLVDGAVRVSCDAASGATFALGRTTVTCQASDRRGNTASASFDITVRDTTAPALSGLADVSAFASSNSAATVNYTLPTASDLVDGSVEVTCSPAPGSTFALGRTTVNCAARDAAGNARSGTFNVNVGYNFGAFVQPVDSLPTINLVKAGSAVPVKFSLAGNQGLAIMQTGFPKSGVVACTTAAGDELGQTVTAGSSSLQYDATTDQYTYVWKTERSWTGCRSLHVTLRDGTTRTAVFRFR